MAEIGARWLRGKHGQEGGADQPAGARCNQVRTDRAADRIHPGDAVAPEAGNQQGLRIKSINARRAIARAQVGEDPIETAVGAVAEDLVAALAGDQQAAIRLEQQAAGAPQAAAAATDEYRRLAADRIKAQHAVAVEARHVDPAVRPGHQTVVGATQTARSGGKCGSRARPRAGETNHIVAGVAADVGGAGGIEADAGDARIGLRRVGRVDMQQGIGPVAFHPAKRFRDHIDMPLMHTDGLSPR